MRGVNLLPPDYRPAKQAGVGDGLSKHAVALGGTAAAVAVAALLGVSWQSASKSAKDSQSQLDALRARIAAVSEPASSTNQTVRARIEQVMTADAARVSWDGFLQKLSRVLPEDVWLTTLQAPENAPATPGTDTTTTTTTGAPTNFTVSGYTYSQASVARLMRRLSMLPWLSDVSLSNSTLTVVGTKSVFQFTIVGGVNALPAKEAS